VIGRLPAPLLPSAGSVADQQDDLVPVAGVLVGAERGGGGVLDLRGDPVVVRSILQLVLIQVQVGAP